MHKRGIIRYANYTVCASVFIHFCMQRKNNENIPIIPDREKGGIERMQSYKLFHCTVGPMIDVNDKHRVCLPIVMAQNTEYFWLYRNSQLHCDVTPTSRIFV